jgi:hypothetical protein
LLALGLRHQTHNGQGSTRLHPSEPGYSTQDFEEESTGRPTVLIVQGAVGRTHDLRAKTLFNKAI